MTTNIQVEEKLKQVVAKVQQLPTLPQMFETLSGMLSNPRTSAKDVAEVIESDPSITAKILKVVNSPFYGVASRVSTVTHAIVILGFNTVKSIVLSSSIFDLFKADGKSAFNAVDFWKHSICVGACARAIGKMLGMKQHEELFVAGLLHDMGKVVIVQHLKDEASKINVQVSTGNCLMMKAEENVMGVNHADIGAWLFEKWALPKGMIETTKFHHNPSMAQVNPDATCIIHLADIVARAMGVGSGGDPLIPEISEYAWKKLGFAAVAGNPPRAGASRAQFDKIIAASRKELEAAVAFLDFIRT